jgi:hypothetical protein
MMIADVTPSARPSVHRSHTWRATLLAPPCWLFGLSFVLYLPGIWWGLPEATGATALHGWDIDGVAGIPVLSELSNLLREPQPDWYLMYPAFHYLVLGALYAPYLGFLLQTGGFAGPQSAYPFGFADPVTAIRTLALIGHITSLLMACGVVVTTYFIGQTIWNRAAGVWAAVVMLLATPMVYYARTGNLDAPMMLWIALGVLAIARILQDGFTPSRAAWLGVAAALSVATKDQAYAAWLPAFLILIVEHVRRTRSWRAPLALIGSGALAYAAATGMLIDPMRHVQHIRFALDIQSYLDVRATWNLQRPATPAGYAHLLWDAVVILYDAFGPFLLAFGAAGLLVSWRGTRFTRVLLAMCLAHVAFVLIPTRLMLPRYLFFVILAVALWAGRACAHALGQGGRLRAATAGITLGVVWQIGIATDLTYQMLRDARYDAARWLAQHASAGDRGGFFGSSVQLPNLPVGMEEIKLADDAAAARAVLAGHSLRYVFVIPDWTSDERMVHSRAMPAELYRALQTGELGYARVATFETRPLFGRRLRHFSVVNPPIQVFERQQRARRPLRDRAVMPVQGQRRTVMSPPSTVPANRRSSVHSACSSVHNSGSSTSMYSGKV